MYFILFSKQQRSCLTYSFSLSIYIPFYVGVLSATPKNVNTLCTVLHALYVEYKFSGGYKVIQQLGSHCQLIRIINVNTCTLPFFT